MFISKGVEEKDNPKEIFKLLEKKKNFFFAPPFLKVRTKNSFFQDSVFLKRVLHTHKFQFLKIVTFIRE